MANSNTSLKKHAPTSMKGTPSTLASPSSAKTKAGSPGGGITTVSKKKPPAAATSTAIVISDKTAANRPIQKSVKVQDESPPKTGRREERQRRGFTVCMGVILCLILLLILGLVLGLVVFGKDDNNSMNNNNNNNSLESSQSSNGAGGSNGGQTPTFPMPTQNSPNAPAPSAADNGNSSPVPPTAESSPVISPVTSPTLRPTTPRPVAPVAPAPTSLLQPSSSQFIILPYADTFVYRNGFTPYEAYGTEDTLLVQNGPDGVNEIPDAVGLLGFDLSTLPSSYSQVVLQLYHQAASRNRGAATLTIRLLPSTPLAIETLHAGIFNPTDDEGTFGPTFNVSPGDTIVQVDITNLVRNRSDDQLFLMIENRGAEQGEGAEGDRFYTRETNDPPQLIVDV